MNTVATLTLAVIPAGLTASPDKSKDVPPKGSAVVARLQASRTLPCPATAPWNQIPFHNDGGAFILFAPGAARLAW